jgi:hypothetical protein
MWIDTDRELVFLSERNIAMVILCAGEDVREKMMNKYPAIVSKSNL